MSNLSRKVLVVKDEVKSLEEIKSFLESKNFIVITADNGKTALELFEEEDISLILLDLMLPELSGDNVCQTIRMKSRVPIIMLTSKYEESDMLKSFKSGADDYITKPFNFNTLYARIEAILRRFDNDVNSVTPNEYKSKLIHRIQYI